MLKEFASLKFPDQNILNKSNSSKANFQGIPEEDQEKYNELYTDLCSIPFEKHYEGNEYLLGKLEEKDKRFRTYRKAKHYDIKRLISKELFSLCFDKEVYLAVVLPYN